MIQLCKEILPRVDETFCAYKEIERVYLDKQDQDGNTKLPEDKVAEISITGKAHKRFGYNEPVEYEGGVYYEVFNGSDKRIVKCAVPIKRYTFALIAKCVTYYLTHPKTKDNKYLAPILFMYRGVMVVMSIRSRRATDLD